MEQNINEKILRTPETSAKLAFNEPCCSVRVKDEFKMSLCDEGVPNKSCGVAYNCRQDQEHRAIWRCFCHLVDEIHSVGRTLGKDGKFQLFVCLSLR